MKVTVDDAGKISVVGSAKEWTDVLGYAWRAEEGPATGDTVACVKLSLEQMARDKETKETFKWGELEERPSVWVEFVPRRDCYAVAGNWGEDPDTKCWYAGLRADDVPEWDFYATYAIGFVTSEAAYRVLENGVTEFGWRRKRY